MCWECELENFWVWSGNREILRGGKEGEILFFVYSFHLMLYEGVEDCEFNYILDMEWIISCTCVHKYTSTTPFVYSNILCLSCWCILKHSYKIKSGHGKPEQSRSNSIKLLLITPSIYLLTVNIHLIKEAPSWSRLSINPVNQQSRRWRWRWRWNPYPLLQIIHSFLNISVISEDQGVVPIFLFSIYIYL